MPVPNRVKLGYATGMEARLSDYRIANPDVKLVSSWPCEKVWEKTAMAAIANTVAELVRDEVYDCNDIGALRVRGDAFLR